MVLGLIISIFQAVTQVSDMALTFVPKLVFVSGFILITLPWIGDLMEGYTKDLWELILIFGK